jgi:hypothetical protein
VLFNEHDMPVAPEHLRTARLAVPRLPLPAIVGFALFGVGGAVFLAYTTFSHGEIKRSAMPSADAQIYEARAVPFELPRENAAKRAESIARALSVVQTEVQSGATTEAELASTNAEPTLLADSHRELRGFNRFANFAGNNTYLSVAGASFGMSAQNTPAGFMAPDAEMLTASVVPEASTWMCGGALFMLVAARGAHARWHRRRRRD